MSNSILAEEAAEVKKFVCNTCKIEKPCTEFYRNNALMSGYSGRCKACEKASDFVFVGEIIVTHKICHACNKDKASEEFHKDKSSRDGLHPRCRECVKQGRTKYETKRCFVVTVESKICRYCKLEKLSKEFWKDSYNLDGLNAVCVDCMKANKDYEAVSEYRKDWYKKNAKVWKGYTLKAKYGITMDDFESMLLDQDNACAICRITFEDKGPYAPCVDHDHETNVVRKLLCGNCNRMLGMAQENPLILARGIQYLAGRGIGINDFIGVPENPTMKA